MKLQAVGYILSFGQGPKLPKSAADLLRERLLTQAGVSTSDLFTREGHKEEHGLNKMVSNLLKPSTVQHELLKGLDINAFQQIQENAYSGEMLSANSQHLSLLQKAGIQRIIDLTESSLGKEASLENGMEYTSFPIGDSHFWIDLHRDGINREFLDRFVGLISAMRKGNFYIGCAYGTARTTEALMLSHFFNPKDSQFNYFEPESFGYIYNILPKIHKKLTAADKEKMGWTPQFEAESKAKIQKAIDNYEND